MWALLVPILSQIFGENGAVGQYLKIKADQQKAADEYRLAALQAQAQQATQQLVSDSADLANRLQATSQSFKQGTFYPLWAIVIFSVIFPSKAEVMWHNFSLMPDWFQWLFLSVYSAIWGLPFIKTGYGAFTELLAGRRDFKLQKASIVSGINEKKLAEELRKNLFPKGMTESQWQAILNSAQNSLEQQ